MDKITVKVVGLTTEDEDEIKKISVDDYIINGGHSANICYTQKSLDEIKKEPIEKTIARAEGNMENKHHSVFGHNNIELYFEGIPKIIAMLINNEKEYNTSEKSGRYTTMFGSEKENELYNKWKEIFVKEIKEQYPNEIYLNDKMINKKAMENSRYLLSVFMRTKMKYTTSFRQLNYLYDFTCKAIDEPTLNPLKIASKPYLEEFKDALLSTGFIIPGIKDYRNRSFSLIQDDNSFDDQFGRCYSVNYDSTFPALADLQRHRSLDYSLSLKEDRDYYVPRIIREKSDLVREWKEDIDSSTEFPQGLLVNVNETGKYEDFIMKLYERLCTAAQLEVCDITKDTLNKYIKSLELSDLKSNKKILEEMKKYTIGARCTFDGFDCPSPCKFVKGIILQRKI